MRRVSLFAICLALAAAPTVAAPSAIPLTKASALQAIGVSEPDATVTQSKWNGQPTVFIEYVVDRSKVAEIDPVEWDEPPSQHVDAWTDERDKELRRLVAVQQGPDGNLHSTIVTDIQSDALFAGVAAIGFANADRDRGDREIIVLVVWEEQVGVGGGQEFQVRIFKQPDPSKPFLPVLKDLSDHFGVQFEGRTFDTGDPVHARFKTIPAVRRELKRMGY